MFYEPRDFTKDAFPQFMFSQSKPHPVIMGLIKRLKEKYGLKIIEVSNEARYLNTYRIDKYELAGFIDFFVSSTYVNIHKPDKNMFKLALDMAHVQPVRSKVCDNFEFLEIELDEIKNMNNEAFIGTETGKV